MEKVTDWFKLWEQLAEKQTKAFERKKEGRDPDFWKDKAGHFEKMVKKRWSKPDSSRQFLASTLEADPGSTLLDIGAGTGAWSAFLAPYAKEITALEPSVSMGEILNEKIKRQGISNVRLVKGSWPDVDLAPHDYILASHSMYGATDFRAFIRKMVVAARKSCFLVLRVVFADTIMSRAAQKIWGQPYDSPNFQIAYNALLQMGIYPNVLMEIGEPWEPWANDSLEEALAEIKNRLDINDIDEHDEFLMSLLEGQLTEKDGKVYWPVGNRSALVYWEV